MIKVRVRVPLLTKLFNLNKSMSFIFINNIISRNVTEFFQQILQVPFTKILPSFLGLNLILPLIGILLVSFSAGIPNILKNKTLNNFKIQHKVAL